jgi:hypothetical protein
MSASRELREARRHLASFRAYVRATNLTGWTTRNARGQYRRAFVAVVLAEDAHGIDATAALSDRLTALRHEAGRAGLLSPSDVFDAETAAFERLDRLAALRGVSAHEG